MDFDDNPVRHAKWLRGNPGTYLTPFSRDARRPGDRRRHAALSYSGRLHAGRHAADNPGELSDHPQKLRLGYRRLYGHRGIYPATADAERGTVYRAAVYRYGHWLPDRFWRDALAVAAVAERFTA